LYLLKATDVISLSLNFVSVCFAWVKRTANGTAHELAKFSFPLDFDFNCNASSLLLSVKDAWQRNALYLS
jgi:hypothetical protein